MSDTKLADLTALTAPSGDDLLYVVDDPAGTPSDKKLALDNLFTRGTVTVSSPVIDAAQTWNDGGVTFTGLKFNATDTASAAGSLLMDLQVGGASRFRVQKNGDFFSRTSLCSVGVNVGVGVILNQSGSVTVAGAIGGFNFTPTNNAGSAADLRLTRRAAANLRFGAADAAAPVAQTLSVQSGTAGASALTVSISGTALTIAGAITGTIAIGHAVTGTGVSAGTLITAGSGSSWTVNNSQTVGPITAYFNSVGQNLTITGSQGSGPSAGGSIIFQVAPAGSAATTAQNALSTALTIDSSLNASFGNVIILPGGFALNGFGANNLNFNVNSSTGSGLNTVFQYLHSTRVFKFANNTTIAWTSGDGNGIVDLALVRDAASTLALRSGTIAQEQRVYGSYTSGTNFQRMSIKTLRESSGALSGASYVTTIAIPAYANLIGVTTRVTTAVTGATTYDVGDGSDVDLWGAAIAVALGSQSRTADFTAVAAVGAAATSRTVTLTANGSNFTGGIVEICLHYLTTEAD
jgi:hypothetical protein